MSLQKKDSLQIRQGLKLLHIQLKKIQQISSLPTVKAKEGTTFTGWLVNGKEEGFWSADAKTFGITGLAHFPEGSDTGYIVVTAQFKKAEVAKRSVTINVAIDPKKGGL